MRDELEKFMYETQRSLAELEKDIRGHSRNTEINFHVIKKLQKKMEQLDLDLHETGRIVEENTNVLGEQTVRLREDVNALDDMINDVYVDSIQDLNKRVKDQEAWITALNNRLQVLEGAENLRTKREDTLGHLKIIGQLEEEVERLEKQQDNLLQRLKEISDAHVKNPNPKREWYRGYTDGLKLAERIASMLLQK